MAAEVHENIRSAGKAQNCFSRSRWQELLWMPSQPLQSCTAPVWARRWPAAEVHHSSPFTVPFFSLATMTHSNPCSHTWYYNLRQRGAGACICKYDCLKRTDSLPDMRTQRAYWAELLPPCSDSWLSLALPPQQCCPQQSCCLYPAAHHATPW